MRSLSIFMMFLKREAISQSFEFEGLIFKFFVSLKPKTIYFFSFILHKKINFNKYLHYYKITGNIQQQLITYDYHIDRYSHSIHTQKKEEVY